MNGPRSLPPIIRGETERVFTMGVPPSAPCGRCGHRYSHHRSGLRLRLARVFRPALHGCRGLATHETYRGAHPVGPCRCDEFDPS